MSDLLDRLRAVESSRGDSDYVSNWHRNPDGPDAANEIEKLRGIIRLQDAAIRSGDTAALTTAEREALDTAEASLMRESTDLHTPLPVRKRLGSAAATLRGLLERLAAANSGDDRRSVGGEALSPMSLPPSPEEVEEEEGPIWHSATNKPD